MRKRFFSMVIILAILFNLGSSFAANTSDTSWQWEIPWWTLERYTELRRKKDNSPIYFDIEEFYSRDRGGTLELKVVGSDGRMFSYGDEFIVHATSARTYCISSNAYEDKGYDVAVKVRGDRQKSSQIDAKGVWSPDSWSCSR